jgi:acetate---CoA ligase (ADP-forming)
VAVIGASRTPGGIGASILANLTRSGFTGRLVAVHPSASEVQGVAAWPSVDLVPGPIDLAVVAVPAAVVPGVVEQCIAKGVAGLVVITAGFRETGQAGRAREVALVQRVREAGVRMIGPNCMGVINTDPAVRLNATFAPAFPPTGRVAFLTQSGALGLAILQYAERMRLGLSTFVSVGNAADISSNDLLAYWAEDPATSVVLLYLESVGNPRTFARLAAALSR